MRTQIISSQGLKIAIIWKGVGAITGSDSKHIKTCRTKKVEKVKQGQTMLNNVKIGRKTKSKIIKKGQAMSTNV